MRDRLRPTASRSFVTQLALVALVSGCLGPIERVGERFHHREHGFAVMAPQGAAGAWEQIDVAGATLAFRGPAAQTVVVKSRCGKPVAAPQLMARHLFFGLPDRALVASQPAVVDGTEAWLQVVDVSEHGQAVRIKALTVVVASCSYDLVLAAGRDQFDAVEAVFDRWWSSFEFTPGAGPAERSDA